MKKKLISGAMLLIMLGTTYAGVVSAREIGEFSQFRITSSYGQTGFLNKVRNGGTYTINLSPTRGTFTVKNRMVNSAGEARSGVHIDHVGHRSEHSNWGSKGYIYALQMSRENWWDGAKAITGSWSPDQK